MQHLHIRLGGQRYLLCEPQTTASGKPAAYGAFLRSVDQAIRAAAALRATLFFVGPARQLNAAIFDLQSPDVRMIGQSDWCAPILRAVWWGATPFRYGAPFRWFVSGASSALRVLVEAAKHRARQYDWRRLDRALDRFGHRCRRASHSYERRAAAGWHRLLAEARHLARQTGAKRHRIRLRLRTDAQVAVDALLKHAGIDLARPLVLLHVRGPGYRQRPATRQQRLDRLRDAQIEAYRPAVTWLTERGYQVVRIGDATMTPCPLPGVVDLATAQWRTDAFELWAALNSRFFVCCDSGPYLLAPLAAVPALSVNVFRVGYNTIGKHDRYIVKRVFDRVRGRCLSLAEQLNEAFLCAPLDLERYDWIDNTPDDIREAVEDMVALIENPGQPRTVAQQRHDQLLDALASRPQPQADATARLLFRRGGRGTIAPRFAARYLDPEGSPRLEPDPRMR